jgi:hypothetical protein
MAIETTSDLSSVVSSQIVDGAVTSAKIGTGAVVAASIAAGAVGSAAISAGAINSTHIGANAVVSGDIAAGAVGSAALAAGAVVAAAIAAGAVGTAAISSGAATSGQILQANGSGAVTFATPAAGGGMTLIATATPSAATSLSFSSIPTTYKHLLLVWRSVFQSGGKVGWNVRFNSDSASNYGFSSFSVRSGSSVVDGPASTTTQIGSTSDTRASVLPATQQDATIPGRASAGNLMVYRYTELEPRFMESTSSQNNPSDGINKSFVAGVYNSSASAITSIEFIRTSTQTITGNFYLYGVS